MRTVEIDDETHRFILQNTSYVGETEGVILSRLLGIGQSAKAPEIPTFRAESTLEIHLQSLGFKHATDAVGRFLSILGFIYQEHANKFHQVESIRGRGRLYFAKSADALNAAGKSVSPKQIPGSPFWVVTNSPTILKQLTLEDVMDVFHYSRADIAKASRAVAGPV